MAGFLLRRLVGFVATLLVASFAIYSSMYLAPGSPESLLTGGRSVTPETLAAIREQFGLDQPFLARYWTWLTGVIQGDLGDSLVVHQDVASVLGPHIRTTLMLVAYSAILILLAGIALGIASGLRPGAVDTAILAVTSLGIALPSFVAAVILIAVFAVNLGWFPVFGAGEGFTDRIWHLTLPAIALMLGWSAFVARVTRSSVRAEIGTHHVETARSRGIPELLVVRRHILRNALVPIVTVGGLAIASLIAGTILVERAFALNGLGSLLVDSVNQKDYAVVQAVSLLLVAAFLIANTAVDVIASFLDPRLKTAVSR